MYQLANVMMDDTGIVPYRITVHVFRFPQNEQHQDHSESHHPACFIITTLQMFLRSILLDAIAMTATAPCLEMQVRNVVDVCFS